MTAQTTKTPQTQLAELASVVELIEIRPIGFLTKLVRDAPQAGVPVAVDIKNHLGTKRGEGTDFLVQADFSLGLSPESAPTEEFLKLRYTIISRYRLPAEFPLEQELLDLFAKTNGMVHLWPYLRAFVANSCAQLGLVPITLPPFRVKGGQPPAAKPSAAKP